MGLPVLVTLLTLRFREMSALDEPRDKAFADL